MPVVRWPVRGSNSVSTTGVLGSDPAPLSSAYLYPTINTSAINAAAIPSRLIFGRLRGDTYHMIAATTMHIPMTAK
jgi:hypothetical protein